eukprot:6490941-Amphidinium_carterae.4
MPQDMEEDEDDEEEDEDKEEEEEDTIEEQKKPSSGSQDSHLMARPFFQAQCFVEALRLCSLAGHVSAGSGSFKNSFLGSSENLLSQNSYNLVGDDKRDGY